MSWPALSITEPRWFGAPSPRQPDQPIRGRRTTRNPAAGRRCSSVAPCPSLSTRPAPGPPCCPDVAYDISLDLTDRETFGVPDDGPLRLRRAGRRHLPRARRRRGPDGRPASTDWSYDGRRIHLIGPRGEQRGRGRGPAPLRHRRRRDAHVHRPRRRGDLRVGVRRHGHRPAGLPLLRPERPQGADHPARSPRPRTGRCSPTAGRPSARTGAGGSRPTPPIPTGDVRGLRRAVALGDLGAPARGGPAVRLARPALAGRRARPRRRRAAADHRAVLRPLRGDLRRAVRLRLLRPGVRARPELGRPGDARLRDLPRRVPARSAG